MTVAEAKHLAEEFRFEYNNNRPHSSLGYKTPHCFPTRFTLIASGPKNGARSA